MTMLDALLESIVADPDPGYWLVLADWVEEHDDDPRRAELLRLHRRLLLTSCEPDAHPQRREWQARVVELIRQGVRPVVPQQTLDLGLGVEMDFSFIPPGSFLMGSPAEEEGRGEDEAVRRVTLTEGFWLGVHPVTQKQWRTVMGTNPSGFQGDDLPVETISWDDCVAFCTRLGKEFRLPKEAEWEYACRAGTTTPYFFGEAISTALANYDDTHSRNPPRWTTTPGGTFPPNAWGLYDTHGNVAEWCQERLLRGGFFYSWPRACRSACRLVYDSDSRFFTFGCRICREYS